MNKPIKPNITIPQSFAKNGVKTDFDSDLIAEGFDNLKPDVLAGDNLNKFIDDSYKGINYAVDGVSDLYTSWALYDSTEIYNNKSIVYDFDENNQLKLFHSKQNDNTGHLTSETDWWEEVQLGVSEEVLAQKANIDLSNCTKPYITETYVNGTSGYRIWSDGYCEQWGQGKVISSGYYMRVNFIKPFANTNYIGYGIALSSVENVDVLNYVGIQVKKVNRCTFIGSTHASIQSNMTMLWKVEGYIA